MRVCVKEMIREGEGQHHIRMTSGIPASPAPPDTEHNNTNIHQPQYTAMAEIEERSWLYNTQR